MVLILASSSPRRVQLMKWAGFKFKKIRTDVNERKMGNESSQKMVKRLSRLKATVGLQTVLSNSKLKKEEVIVLSADTIVTLSVRGKELILGKPRSVKDAKSKVKLISGRRSGLGLL
jgi:septum formation protein